MTPFRFAGPPRGLAVSATSFANTPPPLPKPAPAGPAAQTLAEPPVANAAALTARIPGRFAWINWRAAWRWTPSWLVSGILHLAALLVLAWVQLQALNGSVPVLEVESGVTEQFELEAVTTEWMPELETLDTLADTKLKIDASELTPVAELVDPEVGSDASPVLETLLTSSSVRSIDDLFRGGGGNRSFELPSREALFFGVKARGSRFVFIVDSSRSMRGGKFEEAKRELLYAIRRLGKDQSFYVMFFDIDVERMTLEPGGEPETTFAPATGQNIQRLEYWVHTIENELKTNPYDAVKFAMELNPDAIYLLTDGQFTDRGRTTRYLAQANQKLGDKGRRVPKVPIHTIGFRSRDGEEVLRDIATKYGGTYQYVDDDRS